MSATIQKQVLARAIYRWSDPKHRARGHWQVYDRYCAIGVLRKAYRETSGVKRMRPDDERLQPIIQMMGYEDENEVINENDNNDIGAGPEVVYKKMVDAFDKI